MDSSYPRINFREGMAMKYIPLNISSSYSLLQSTLTIENIKAYAAENELPAIALSDHEVMYASVDFYQTIKKSKMNPVVGSSLPCQLTADGRVRMDCHCYAKNYQGYQQLLALVNQNQLTDEVLSLQEILEESDHLICVFALQSTQVDSNPCQEFTPILDIFETIEQSIYLGMDIDLLSLHPEIKEVNHPLLAFDHFSYEKKEDLDARLVLQAIQDKSQLDYKDQKKLERIPHEFALEEIETIKEVYLQAGMLEVVQETEKIAADCQLSLPLNEKRLPKFPAQKSQSSHQLLVEKSYEGLKKRNLTEDNYISRLEKELRVIEEMGFSDYFLIVWDIMLFARNKKIQTGPGRGSAAGSLVAYALEIIEVDPIEYDLIFERFLNSERYSPPDIDLDFPDNKRQDILDYIQKRYGSGHVAQIVTFGSLGAKQAIRDAGRVFGLSQEELSSWSQSIPSKPGITLAEAQEESKEFVQKISTTSFNQFIYFIASKIEGLPRNISTHASGIVISDQELTEIVPLQAGMNHMLQTQYTMHDLETVGLLKFDILGLKNLTILNDAIYFAQMADPDFKISYIPFDDKESFEIFQKADTHGIFQFESDGMKRVLSRLQPTEFEDIVAVIALYRPGPMNEISSYINRKKGDESVEYLHPDLRSILDRTYGIIVYQEQIMRIVQQFAGYSLGEADLFRRAISKKNRQLIEEQREHFLTGSMANGYSQEEAQHVYLLIERFADYGFNRSHAVAYSKIAYQLAYLKAHFPLAFYVAILRSASSQKEELYLKELLGKNIKILGPSINRSYRNYYMDAKGIRMGFGQVKQLKRGFAEEIIHKRYEKGFYQDFIDFCKKIEPDFLSTEVLELLIHVGVFDEFDQNRGTLLQSIETILTNIESGQFTATLGEIFSPHYIESKDLTVLEKMEQEYEYTGFIFTDHPSGLYQDIRIHNDIRYIGEGYPGLTASLLVTIHDIKGIQTKNGEPMAFLTASDPSGFTTLTLFPRVYRQYIKEIEIGKTYQVLGKIEKRKGAWSVQAAQIQDAEKIHYEMTVCQLFLRVSTSQADLSFRIEQIIKRFSGHTPVYIHFEDKKETVKLKRYLWMKVNDQSLTLLKDLLGEENVVVTK